MTSFTVDYFISKFEAIPEERWCVGEYTKEVNGIESHCALGWCGAGYYNGRAESNALQDIFWNTAYTVTEVNDNDGSCFPQPTPKQRILAALNQIKKESQCSNQA